MKCTALITLVMATTATAKLSRARVTYEADFVEHVNKYDLKFSGSEFSKRLSIYAANTDIIEEHNSKPSTFELGVNQFTHLTFDEFEAQHLAEPMPRKEGSRYVNAFEGVKASSSVDWATTDMVTGVKDQGSCGSCWAFSTTGGLEGAYYKKYNTQVSFSEQQLVSCDTDADQGCNGGLMDNAFQYIAANGLCKEADYPYTSSGGRNARCKSDCTIVDGTTGLKYTDVSNSESALASAVSQQPISVAVDADSNWQHYKSGIMTVVEGTQLDHGVLLVGYGTDGGDNYWKIKNSWASSWGESGYIRISKDINQADGPCGITSSASYPTL